MAKGKQKARKKSASLTTLFLLLLLTAILLISSTYAWFTANQTVTISTLNVQVEATNGLQISADGTTWKAVLTNDDINPANVTATYASAKNQIPTSMMPTSSAGITDSDGHLVMFGGNVQQDTNGAYALVAPLLTDTNGTTGNYIVFDCFLKVDQDTPIYLQGTNSKVADDKNLANAARIAFVNEGTTDVASNLATVQALNGATSANVTIWEPNCNLHTGSAITNALSTYGISTTADATTALAYRGVSSAITLENDVLLTATAADNHFKDVATAGNIKLLSTKSTETDNKLLWNLSAGITKVRIYMYVEGQDVDCENAASGSNLSFDLQFTQLAS